MFFINNTSNKNKRIVETNQNIENIIDSYSAPTKESTITLLNSVRYFDQQDLWIDFKNYLIAQKQSKSSIRNKLAMQKDSIIFCSKKMHMTF